MAGGPFQQPHRRLRVSPTSPRPTGRSRGGTEAPAGTASLRRSATGKAHAEPPPQLPAPTQRHAASRSPQLLQDDGPRRSPRHGEPAPVSSSCPTQSVTTRRFKNIPDE